MKLKMMWSVLALALIINLPTVAQDKAKPKATEELTKTESSPSTKDKDEAEDDALRKAIEESRGNQQQIIINLEAFLKAYPDSTRRAEIERELYKIAEELRDRNRQITYAERLVAANGNDLVKMTFLVTALRDRKATGDLAKALTYSDKMVKAVEDIFATRTKPARVSPGQWEQQKSRTFASVYLLRGQVNNDLGNLDKAEADLLKSYKQSALAASVATPVILLALGYRPEGLLAAIMTALLLWKHEANIRRLLKGEEPKIGAKA